MSTLAANNLGLADIAKRTDPDGGAAEIAELLEQENPIAKHVPWVETNKIDSHVYTLRTSLPTIANRAANEGTTPTKTTTAQSEDITTIFEDWITVDEVVAERGGNVAAIRAGELKGKVEAFTQSFTQMLIYGNHSTTPRAFTGFNPRLNSTTANNGQNLLLAGGTGSDNSSILFVDWGQNKTYGIYPKGTHAGLYHKDWGKQIVTDSAGVAGSMLAAYREQLQWQCGLVVKDWRSVARIANIDISALVAKSSAADLWDYMIKAWHRIMTGRQGLRIYMNPSCFEMLDIQGRDDVGAGGGITYQNIDGMVIPTFRGAPIHVTDRLAENESLAA